MQRLVQFLSVLAFFLAAACGGSDDENPAVDAPVAIDAATDAPAASNPLGQVCAVSGGDCPAGSTCSGVQGVGSTSMGWCSPTCTQNGGECAAGYAGPAGGDPQCALVVSEGQPPSLCAIICTQVGDCPSSLSCLPVPGQSVSICAPQ
jgi:hypothetical protein